MKTKKQEEEMVVIDFDNIMVEDIEGKSVKADFPTERRKEFANLIYTQANCLGMDLIGRKIYAGAKLELVGDEVDMFKRIMDIFGERVFVAIAQRAIYKLLEN